MAHQALESSELQVFLDGANVVWLDVLFVWVACARKSSAPDSHTSEVRFSIDVFLVIDSGFFSLLAAERQAYFRTFIIATVAGVYSLFPLIFTPFGSSFL